MSKIGQKPIVIPSSVQIEVTGTIVTVKGSKATLTYDVPHFIKFEKKDDQVIVTRENESKRQKSLHGLYRSIIANAVRGVDTGWTRKLEVVGTGFNAKMQGKNVVLKVGYSHTVTFEPKEGIEIELDGSNLIIVKGADKQKVGETAHQIKIIRKPDIYKGKGIRYEGERIRLKPGKKAKA